MSASTIKISILQIVLLIASDRIVPLYIYSPVINTPPANHDMWFVVLLSVVYIFIVSFPLLFLSSRFDSMTPVEYAERILGRPLGKLAGAVFIVFMLYICLIMIALIANFVQSVMLPETPEYAIILPFLLICVYATYQGVEGICRLALVFVPLIFVTIILFTILNIKHFDYRTFLPVLADSEFTKLHLGAMILAVRFNETIPLCMLAPYVEKKGHLYKIFLYIVIIATIATLVIVMTTQMTLGINLAKKLQFPYFDYARTINVFAFIERIEHIAVTVTFVGEFIRFSTWLFAAALGMQQLFGAKSHKKFIIPIAVVLFIIAIYTDLLKSVVLKYLTSTEVYPYIMVGPMFILPLILMIAYLLQQRKLKNSGKAA